MNDEKSDETTTEEEEDEMPPFTTFDATYRCITWIFSFGMMYPNPETDKERLVALFLITGTALPFISFTLIDMFNLLFSGDVANFIRISTVVGPFSAGFMKSGFLWHKRKQAEIIINEVKRDFEMANTRSRRYREAVKENIKANMLYERTWTFCTLITVCIFPIQAAVMNAHSNWTEGKNKYMITEFSVPLVSEEELYSTPCFEIMFAYTFYCCFLYFLFFSAYDCFIMVSIGHSCLKFELFTITLEEAVLTEDLEKRRKMMLEIIYEQNRAIWFLDLVEDTFQMWLGLCILAVLMQICFCLFYIMEGFGFDERYSIFTTATVIYIYLICSSAHKLKTAGEMAPVRMYCCGWEHLDDRDLWKTLPFMISRFQKTFEYKAFHFFVYDLELFVYIVKTAYSLFTLLQNT